MVGINVILRRSYNHCYIEKAMIITYFESVAFVNQHIMHLRIIVICGLSGSTNFFHISHKRHDYRENVTERKICVLIFSIKFA